MDECVDLNVTTVCHTVRYPLIFVLTQALSRGKTLCKVMYDAVKTPKKGFV